MPENTVVSFPTAARSSAPVESSRDEAAISAMMELVLQLSAEVAALRNLVAPPAPYRPWLHGVKSDGFGRAPVHGRR